MTGYLLSILGIVMAGVLIDIIMPSGQINKFIKSIYSIFVVVILISPLWAFLKKDQNYLLSYEDYKINAALLNYIYLNKTESLENSIFLDLKEAGFDNVDIKIEYSIENNEMLYNLCKINLKNMTISEDKQHINKYEFIKEVVKNHTNLTDEEIVFDE